MTDKTTAEKTAVIVEVLLKGKWPEHKTYPVSGVYFCVCLRCHEQISREWDPECREFNPFASVDDCAIVEREIRYEVGNDYWYFLEAEVQRALEREAYSYEIATARAPQRGEALYRLAQRIRNGG